MAAGHNISNLSPLCSVQRAVHSDTGASSDDGNKDLISKKKIRSLAITAGERKTPHDLFPSSLLTKDSEWPEDKGDCVLTSTIYSAPMETNISAIIPTTPNRRLRQLQRTARGHRHRKCERSTHRCASWLRRRSNCSWRRRSPASSAEAVKRMIRKR